MTDRIALLVFHRNDVEGAVRVLDAVGDRVDETTVVDSSSPPQFAHLQDRLAGRSVDLHRVLPLGCTEPLRPFAHAQVRSEVILSVDTDEVPSEPLLRRLRSLPPAAAWRLLRHERGIGARTRLVRVYRRDRVRYQGWNHESPQVDGPVVDLPADEGLEHFADYRSYLTGPIGRREYAAIEARERPPTGRQLRSEFGGRAARLFLPPDDRPVSAGRIRIYATLSLMFPYDGESGIGGQIRNRRWFGRYLVERAKAWARMPPEERGECLAIFDELRRGGGPVPYLGFEEPAYVERLTQTFAWDRSGSEVLGDLLRFRHRAGRPRRDFGEPLPPLAARGTAE